MNEQFTFSAYRLPRLSIKDLVKNVLSFRKKSSQGFNEEAREFVLEVKSDWLTIYEVDFEGSRQKRHSIELSKIEQARMIKSKKYKGTKHVYHIMEEVKK